MGKLFQIMTFDGGGIRGALVAALVQRLEKEFHELLSNVDLFAGTSTGSAIALTLANDTSFGLGSYVYTNDPEQAARVADRIEAGMVYVNLVMADSPELPFGGVKRSGTARELGLLAADEFVNKKLIRSAG